MMPGSGQQAPDLSAIRKLVEDSYHSYLVDLRSLVNIDCGTYTAAGANQVADLMHERFTDRGWTVQRIPHRPGGDEPRLGDVVVATLRGGREEGGRILLVGHMDTVFPEGTAAARPFRVEGSTAYGPGVSDMKGGLLEGLYAMNALQDSGFEAFGPVTYVCNPDEEIGSPFSGPLILERSRGVDACFVLEGARENGDIVSARKGVTDFRIVVRGRAAHAGVEPERGRSATLQAAHTIVALHDLNGMRPGVTVNVGVVQGGTRPNVVADRCELHVDLRAPTQDSFEEAVAALRMAAQVQVVADTEVEVTAMSGFPPMEKTEATARLVERAKAIAGELDFEVKDAATGGASDANPVAGSGIPTLDGLGPIGGADHSPGEWLDLDSVVPRTALLAGLIASPS